MPNWSCISLERQKGQYFFFLRKKKMTSLEHRNARCLRQGCQWPLWYWQRLEFLIQFLYAWVRRRQCLWPYWFCWRMQMSVHADATCWLCIFFQKHISSLQIMIMNLIITYYLILKRQKHAAKLNWFVKTFSTGTIMYFYLKYQKR